MNSFLLSLGIAIVLALVAALVGPYFIDWTDYRAQVEARISEMTGSDATIGGALDIRFLPTGSINISGLEIQRGDVPFPILIVPELSAEFSLAAFLRGRVEILDVNFSQPIVSLTVRDDGSPAFGVGLRTGIDRENIAVGEFNVIDGTLVFVEEDGTPLHTLSGIALSGNAESLAGPIRLEGEFDSDQVRYAFRLGTGRVQADGSARIKLNVTSSLEPGSVSLDVILALRDGRPVVDGAVTIDRLSGEVSAIASGGDTLSDQDRGFDDGSRSTAPAAGPGFDIPWKLTAAISGGVENLLLQDLTIEAGAADKAISLSGTARAGLYPNPQFSAILSARQLDLDRVMGAGAAAGEPVSPAALPGVLNDLAGKFVGLGVPLDLSLSADGVLLGGNLVENLGADLQVRENQIVVDRVSGRLPGGTDLFFSGTFEPGPLPVTNSVVRLSSDNGAALAAWVGIDRAAFGPLFTRGGRTKIAFEGGVSTAPDRISIRDAVASIDGNQISGALSYPLGNNPGDIEISLDFGALDLDRYVPPESIARGLGSSWLEGVAGALLAGRDMAIALKADTLSSGTINAEGLDVNVGVTGDVLTIHQLKIADLSGARFSGQGQIDNIFDEANGAISTRIDIEKLSDFLPLLETLFGVSAIDDDMAGALSPVSIGLNLSADSADAGSTLALEMNGDMAGTAVNFDGSFQGSLANFTDGRISANLKLADVDGRKIIRQLGLGNGSDDQSARDYGRASLDFAVEGLASEALAASGRASFLGGEFLFSGSYFPGIEQSLSGNLDYATDDVAPLTSLLGLPQANGNDMPVRLSGFVVASGAGLKISAFTGQVAGARISGDLDFSSDGIATRIDGAIAADTISVPWLLTLFLGETSGTLLEDGDRWPATPFELSALDKYRGTVAVKADRASIGHGIEIDALELNIVAGVQQVRLENLTARHGDAGIEAELDLMGEGGGRVATTLRIKLDGGNLSDYLARPGGGSYASGLFTLSGQVSGAGRSWRGVVASLSGDGALQVKPGDIPQLDPSAFSALLSDVDDSETPLELTEAIVAGLLGNYLDEGALAHNGMDTFFSLSEGIVSARNAILVGDAMSVRGTLEVDIPQLEIDSRWEFAPQSVQLNDGADIGNIPTVMRRIAGPLGTEMGALDVAALTGWLGVRRMEQSLAELEQARANVREQQAQEQQTLENLASAEPEPALEDAPAGPEPDAGDTVQAANPDGAGETPNVPGDTVPGAPSSVDQADVAPDTPPSVDRAETVPESLPESLPENIPEDTPGEIEVSELPDTSAPPVANPDAGIKPFDEIVQDALRDAGQGKPQATANPSANKAPNRQTSAVPDLPPPTNLAPLGQPGRQTFVVPPRGFNNAPSAPVDNQRPRLPPAVEAPEGAGMMN